MITRDQALNAYYPLQLAAERAIVSFHVKDAESEYWRNKLIDDFTSAATKLGFQLVRADEKPLHDETTMESIRLFVENLYDDAPSAPYDNGGTSDGWHQACNKIQKHIESIQQAALAKAMEREQ